jgi:hypothetical protein
MNQDTWLALAALLFSFLSILYSLRSVQLSRKQLNFAAIISCTERFQAIMPELQSDDTAVKVRATKRYIDLCNEELFYFKHNYLPNEIVDEWLEGMIYYLPHLTEDGQNLNEDDSCLCQIHIENLLGDYPRLKDAFTVSRKYNLGQKSDREALVTSVRRKLELQEKSKSLRDRIQDLF